MIEQQHEMYLNGRSIHASGVYVFIEQQHEMYLNKEILLQDMSKYGIEQQHEMYLNSCRIVYCLPVRGY